MEARWHIAQATEKMWWRWYLHRRSAEDYLHWKSTYWRRFFETFGLPTQPEGKLLEVGCGPAGVGLILPTPRLTVIDPLLDQYRRMFPEIMTHSVDGCRQIIEPLESWATSERFDHVYCFNVINHCRDLDSCATKLVDLLAPGGVLYLSVDCHRKPLLKNLFRILPADVLHPQQCDLKEYTAIFQSRGLQLEASHLVEHGFIFDYHLFIFLKK